MNAVESLLSRLEGVEQTRRGWRARCPAHPDRRPSLSIAVGAGDRVLLHDFAGCQADEVLDAVGLTWRDLHDDRARHPRRPPIIDPLKAALAAALSREQRRRERLAVAFESYLDADRVRNLYALADAAHRVAERLGPAHPDTWEALTIAARAESEARLLEVELDALDLRRSA